MAGTQSCGLEVRHIAYGFQNFQSIHRSSSNCRLTPIFVCALRLRTGCGRRWDSERLGDHTPTCLFKHVSG